MRPKLQVQKKLEQELESHNEMETKAAKTFVKKKSGTETEPKPSLEESKSLTDEMDDDKTLKVTKELPPGAEGNDVTATLVKEKSGNETEQKPGFKELKSMKDEMDDEKTLKEQKPNIQDVKERYVDGMHSELEAKEAGEKDTSNEREMLQLEGVSLKLTRRVVDVVTASLPTILESESNAAGDRLMRATIAISRLEIPEPPLEPLLNSLFTVPEKQWESEHCVKFAFHLTTLCGGKLPFDAAVCLWSAVGASLKRSMVNPTSDSTAFQIRVFEHAVRHASSPSALMMMDMMSSAVSIGTFVERLTKTNMGLKQFPASLSTISQIRKTMSDSSVTEPVEEEFALPNAPYQVDFAFPRPQIILQVVREEHKGYGRRNLNNSGRLMERLLAMSGWETRWIWPNDEIAPTIFNGLPGHMVEVEMQADVRGGEQPFDGAMNENMQEASFSSSERVAVESD